MAAREVSGVTDRQLDHSELDALVLSALSSLPSLAPSRGFQDRVMARVILPAPAPLVLAHRAAAWALQPRRAVALAAAYASCVVVTVLLAAPWVSAHASVFTLAASWIAGQVGASLNAAAVAVASWSVRSGLVDALRSALGSGPRLWATVASVSLGYAAGGYGLHVLLKTPRRSDEITGTL
jgi:hypothetical protein